MKTETIKIQNRWKITLPKHRADFYKQNPDWEAERLKSMNKHLKKHDVVYYIGAEQGEMPALIQKWGTKVCLFEPNYSAWRTIYEIWKLNRLKKPVGLYAMFVGSETNLKPKNPDRSILEGSGWTLEDDVNSKFYDYPKYAQLEMTKQSRFSELHNEKDGLPIVKIDDVTATAKHSPTAFSIDVEGAEFEVLKGAENTLAVYKPKIWLSIHPDFLKNYWKTSANEVLKWLHERGYESTLLADVHEKHYYCEWKGLDNGKSN